MTLLSLDYATLRVIWWFLLGALIIGFTLADGFNLGIAMLLPAIARTPAQRRMLVGNLQLVWKGHECWFLLGVAAIFVAWPTLCQLTFSHFSFLVVLLVCTLLLRPVGFRCRYNSVNPGWQLFWDKLLFLGGLIPAFLFGVIAGNVMQGLPFYFDSALHVYYIGNFWGLFTPFTVLCGFVKCLMLLMYGGVYLTNKTQGELQQRSAHYAYWSAMLLVILFVWGGIWLMWGLPGYVAISHLDPNGPSSPLQKEVVMQLGAWQGNFYHHPHFLIVPALGCGGALAAAVSLYLQRYRAALIASALGIAGMIGTVGASMFPFILPSSIHPGMSLLVWDSSSSAFNLLVMLLAALILVPVVYVIGTYFNMHSKVMGLYLKFYKRSIGK